MPIPSSGAFTFKRTTSNSNIGMERIQFLTLEWNAFNFSKSRSPLARVVGRERHSGAEGERGEHSCSKRRACLHPITRAHKSLTLQRACSCSAHTRTHAHAATQLRMQQPPKAEHAQGRTHASLTFTIHREETSPRREVIHIHDLHASSARGIGSGSTCHTCRTSHESSGVTARVHQWHATLAPYTLQPHAYTCH